MLSWALTLDFKFEILDFQQLIPTFAKQILNRYSYGSSQTQLIKRHC